MRKHGTQARQRRSRLCPPSPLASAAAFLGLSDSRRQVMLTYFNMSPCETEIMSPSRAGAILGAWLLLVVPGLSFVRVRTTFPQSFSAMRARKGYVACAISKTERLRQLLNRKDEILIMPCAYDALSAKLIEMHGFEAMFMTGFGVAGVRGHPDTQLVSYGEMVDTARMIGEVLKVTPCIADGDTGYGNAVNVKRTVKGYAQAGVQGVLIEDQVSPKRCGHTKGKAVVSRQEAYARVQAAVDARNEGTDMIIMARTDANAMMGLDEAIERCKKFREIGADITFLEAPLSEAEMRRYCKEVPGPKLANMVQNGKTPVLPASVLQEIGYTAVIYPLCLFSSALKAMRHALDELKQGKDITPLLATFDETKEVVGFTEYYEQEDRYSNVHKDA